MVLAHKDDAHCLGAALPSASKGKGKVELRSPLGFPCTESRGQEGGAKQGGAVLATSSPCPAFAG